MKLKHYFLAISLLCSMSLHAKNSNPLSVLIIGGGPAGLATAIEAASSGCSVTLVEKRSAYSRPQGLFLFDPSVKLLEKWEISSPLLKTTDLGDGTQIGFVQIKHLEELLDAKASALGVKKIEGEFRNFKSARTANILTAEKKKLVLSYDIIVGADGAHSTVKKALAIGTTTLGTAIGATALIPNIHDPSSEIDVSPSIKKGDSFLRRIKLPALSIVFIQSPHNASEADLEKALLTQGWQAEAQAIAKHTAFILTNVPICLSQSQTFSSEEKSAILVGEAAATASFFQGMGANTALRAAEIAGQFFKERQTGNPDSFQHFNDRIKETTDAMIADSTFLFSDEKLLAHN